MKIRVRDWNLDIDDKLIDYIETEYKTKDIAPNREDIFRALELTALSETKVVIFGQDPYPTKGVATGLAFSSNGCLPASLRNMFKELEADLGINRTESNLEDWAKQGVLLLNTTLTVEVGSPNSHSKIGWNQVTEQVIAQLNEIDRTVVFVLLGGQAQKLEKSIATKHYVLKYTHPSPLSAYRGFFGSKPFSEINDTLLSLGYSQVDFCGKQQTLFWELWILIYNPI